MAAVRDWTVGSNPYPLLQIKKERQFLLLFYVQGKSVDSLLPETGRRFACLAAL
jgi:hypothetical protein